MNVLIIGGSGILSTDFTKKTLNEKNKVWILNRGRRMQFLDPRAELIIADIRKETVGELRKKVSVQKYDVVIDFLSFEPTHIKKILQIIDGLFTQYIFISSATAYIKKSEDEIITEKNLVGNTKWEYAYNKSLCEEFLKLTDICYTIIRPYVTYGKSRIPFPIIPDGYHYTLIERMKQEKPVLLYNDGAAICTLTHTKDFANVLYQLLMNPKAYREDFHITSSEIQTWKDVYFMLCRILKVKPNYVSTTLEEVQRYLPEWYEILRGDKGTNMLFDNSKVLSVIQDLNCFQTTLEDGLTESVNYFIEQPEMQGIDFRWEGRIDYLITKLMPKKKLVCLSTNNKYSNKKILYYLLRYQPLRTIYDCLKFMKKIIMRK